MPKTPNKGTPKRRSGHNVCTKKRTKLADEIRAMYTQIAVAHARMSSLEISLGTLIQELTEALNGKLDKTSKGTAETATPLTPFDASD